MANSFLQVFNDYLMYGKKPTYQATPQVQEAVVPPPETMQAPVSGPVPKDRMVMSTDQPSAFKATPYLPQKPLIVDTPPDRTVTSDDLMAGYGKSKPIIPDLGPRLNQALQDQERSVDDSEKLLNSYLTSDQRADISPMLALLDTTKDKRLINAYKRPLTADEYAGNVAKFQNYLADNRKGVSDSYKSLTAQKSQDRYLENLLRQQQREKSYDLKTREGLFKSFQGDKIATASKEALKGAEDAEALLNTNTPIGDEAFKLALARASGEKGPLSDTDIARWGGSPAYAQRIQRFLEKADTGRLAEEDRKDMFLVIAAMKKRQQAALDKRVQYFSQSVGPKVYGVDSNAAKEILTIMDDSSLPGSSEPQPAPAAKAAPGKSAQAPTLPKTLIGKDGRVHTLKPDGTYTE